MPGDYQRLIEDLRKSLSTMHVLAKTHPNPSLDVAITELQTSIFWLEKAKQES